MLHAESITPAQFAGPTLLAKQPLTVSKKPVKDKAAWTTAYRHLEARLGALRSWRYSWWAHWSRIAEFFLPRRYQWVITANRMSRGSPINDQIIDSTGTQAMNVCASGLFMGLTNPDKPWFELGIGLPWIELEPDGKEWLEAVQERLYTVLQQSNFYTTVAQAFQDVVTFGTAPMIIYEDFDSVVRCYLPCAGEYFLALGARGENDTLYLEFTLTVASLVGRFTVEACPPEVQRAWQEGGAALDREYVVCCAIEPNFPLSGSGGAERLVSDEFTFREVYWLRGKKTDKPLSQAGYRDQPFMTAVWSRQSNDAYGRSPCMAALGDCKQIQLETKRKAEFIDKGVRPPMGADPELKNEPSTIISGGVTFVNTAGSGKKGFWPLFEPNPSWLSGLTADIELVKRRIETCLFVDVFMAITQMEGVQPRNELELTKRDLERLQLLGPVVHQFEREFASPALMRILSILDRRGLIPPRPKSMHGLPIKISYVSIMAMAQKAAESIAMKDVFATLGVLSAAAMAAGVPDPIRVFNLDKSARKYAGLNHYPTDCIFTDQEVAQHDQARQQAKAAAQMPQQAMAAVQAAKTLSDTQVGGPSALGALLGQNPVPGGVA